MKNTSMEQMNALHRELLILRWHYEFMRGSANKELVEWADFFQKWTRSAAKVCDPWCSEILVAVGNLARAMQKDPKGTDGFEKLRNLINEAGRRQEMEIRGIVPMPSKLVYRIEPSRSILAAV